jgi:hypothetical protein
MKKVFEWVKNNPIRSMFLVPILLVATISISHVVSWYDIANPINWAIYLSIAIEVGAMTALVAATNKIKGGVWFMFGMVTLIQMIGNIFFSFKEIDSNGDLFKSWVELTGPLWEMMGSDPTDVVAMKRWLSFLEGGLLPIISLTSLHFFVKYETVNDVVNDTVNEGVNEGVNSEPFRNDFGMISEEEGVLAPESVSNPTYEITKEIFEYKEKLENMPVVETFVDESQYLTLQESHRPVIDTTETISDDIRQIIDEVVTTENTKFPMDMMLEFDDNVTTTTTTDDGVKRLSYVKNT